jgi:hypothetical protein
MIAFSLSSRKAVDNNTINPMTRNRFKKSFTIKKLLNGMVIVAGLILVGDLLPDICRALK